MGRARRPHPGGAARGQPGRELQPGRRVEGHLGAGRAGRGPGQPTPADADGGARAARRPGNPLDPGPAVRPSARPSSSSSNSQQQPASGRERRRRAEPDRRVAVLDGALRRAGRGHRPHPRRPRPPPAGGPVGRRGGRLPGAARGHGRRRRDDGPVQRRRHARDAGLRRTPDTTSIAGALSAARENARGARDAISSEMWECLNATYNALPAMVAARWPSGPTPSSPTSRSGPPSCPGWPTPP